MEAMRQSWSDDRLDDLSERVDRLSDRVDAGFARLDAKIDAKVDAAAAELRQEMNLRFAQADAHIDTRFAHIDMRFDRMEARFDAMQQTMIRVGGGLIGVLIAAGAGLIATQL